MDSGGERVREMERTQIRDGELGRELGRDRERDRDRQRGISDIGGRHEWLPPNSDTEGDRKIDFQRSRDSDRDRDRDRGSDRDRQYTLTQRRSKQIQHWAEQGLHSLFSREKGV
jgi:hypothetical protein